MTDESITPAVVRALREGSSEAAKLLDAGFREPLRAFAARYLRGRDDAEDAVQEVFLKVFASETIPDDFRAWIYRIARNTCSNRIRSRERRRDGVRLDTQFELGRDSIGPMTRLVKQEEAEALERRLRALSEGQQEVLYLRYSQALSREEIATVLDLPESVVKSRLYEAVKKLRGTEPGKG